MKRTKQIDDGGAAFPRPVSEDTTNGTQISDGNRTVSEQGGMTLRAYFAGQAMMGLLADPNGCNASEHMADQAVLAADCLIERLKK